MLVVDTIARVRRDHEVHKKGIKEIARDRGLSRNTVRKIVRGEKTAFRYDRSRQSHPKLGPWTAALDEMLEANEGRRRRERLTVARMAALLRDRG